MMNWSTPVVGWMYDIFGDYAGAFYYCGGISFLAASLMFFVPQMSLQSSRERNQRLANLLKMRNPNRQHSKVMRVLFGCLWKDKHESRTSSHVQYNVIITTERAESVWKKPGEIADFLLSSFLSFCSDQDSGKFNCNTEHSWVSLFRGLSKKTVFLWSRPIPFPRLLSIVFRL